MKNCSAILEVDAVEDIKASPTRLPTGSYLTTLHREGAIAKPSTEVDRPDASDAGT